MEKVEVATAAKGSFELLNLSAKKKKILVLKQNIHTLYKVSSFSDAIISERHTARGTVLQSKRANFVVFKVFCCIQESIQEGSILSLWEGTTSTCTTLWEVTCCHVT